MTNKTPKEILDMLLKMESEIDESKIAGKKGKLKGAPANIAGKIYRDIFGIRREGNIYTNPNAIVIDTLKEGKHDDWNLISIGTKPEKKEKRKFVRRAKIRVEFICCYNGNPQNDPIQIDVELEDLYNNKNDAYKIGNLHEWLRKAFRESVTNISEEECTDWNDKYYPCENTRKLIEILRNPSEGYEGIEPITKIPVTIEGKPTVITIEPELTTMDIIQISRLQKSISKLEKIRQEQQSHIDMYAERIKSGYDIPSSTRNRMEWLNLQNRTNIKIKRQIEAIEKIKNK